MTIFNLKDTRQNHLYYLSLKAQKHKQSLTDQFDLLNLNSKLSVGDYIVDNDELLKNKQGDD